MTKRSHFCRGLFAPLLLLCTTSFFLLTSPARAQDQAADNAAANQLLNDGNYPGAIAAFEQFVKNYPTSVAVSDAQLKLGYAYLLAQQPDQAITNFKKLLAPPTPPEITETATGLIPQALSNKASALPETDGSRKTNFEQAIKAFSDFEAKYPKSDLIENNRYTLALCYYQTQQYEPAIAKLRANLQEFPKSESIADSEYLLALMLATQANVTLNDNRANTAVAYPLYDEAQKILESIIARRADLPLVSDAQFQLGEVLFNRAVFSEGAVKTKLLADSMAAYRNVESTDVVTVEQQAKIAALKDRGRQLLAAKDTKGFQRTQNLAAKEAGKLEALKGKASQRVASHLKMAQIFYQLSTPDLPRYDEARVLLNYLEPLADEAEKKTILYYRTMTYALQGNVEKATAGYETFQKTFPGDPAAENLPLAMGAMLVATDPTKALDYFQKQVQLYPKSPATAAALVEQAKAYSQLQQYDRAAKTFQDYLATKPEKAMALQANLGLGEIYRNTGKLAEADAVYAKIISENTENKAAVMQSSFWRGWILVQQQKFQEAMTALSKFAAQYPDDASLTPNALFTYAQAQKGAGAVDTALKTFQQVATQFPKSEAAVASFFQRNDIAMETSDYAKADAAMREFIAAYPDHPYAFNAYANIAQHLVAQNKPQDAINIYYEFIDKHVQSPLVATVLMQTSAQWMGIATTLGRYAGLTTADRETWTKALNNSIGDAERVIQKYPDSPEVANAGRAILDAQKLFVSAQLKKNDDVETYFTSFAAKFESAPKTRNKILFTLASFIYERDKAKALAQMQAAYDPALVYAASDLDLYGGALVDEKKLDDASAVFAKLAADYPNPPGTDPKAAPLAIQEAQAIALFGQGRVLQAKNQTTEAAAAFGKLKSLYPWSSKIFESDFGIADGLYVQKKYPEAMTLVEGIVKAQTASNDLRAKAMVLGGKIRRDTGDLGAAVDYFIKTDYFYGGVPAVAAEGLYRGAETMEKLAPTLKTTAEQQKMKADTIKYYKQVGEKYPDSPFVAQAQERLKALGQ